MNIGIICKYPIPYGMAATTRIFSYSKGLLECGDKVDVWSIAPNNFNANNNNEGVFNGISYFYSFRSKRFSNKLFHAYEMIYSLFILGVKLHKRDKIRRYDVFIISSDSLICLLYMRVLNILFKRKLIFIFDEYPTPIRGKLKNKIPFWKEVIYRVILSKYSGYISMTENLLKYYKKITDNPGIIISSITDVNRFHNIIKKPINKTKKLIYMGNMELSKDNVDNILYALSILLRDNYDIHLYLFGKPNLKDKSILERIIEQEGLANNTSFRFAQYNDVPKILSEADILVSSQPVTVRADGGFPTKLGEYLMSGTPVLSTNVGETSKYFKDGEHMYFAKPESPLDYANKLKYIIDNYEKALAVAKKGKMLIEQSYSHISAGEKMHKFLKSL